MWEAMTRKDVSLLEELCSCWSYWKVWVAGCCWLVLYWLALPLKYAVVVVAVPSVLMTWPCVRCTPELKYSSVVVPIRRLPRDKCIHFFYSCSSTLHDQLTETSRRKSIFNRQASSLLPVARYFIDVSSRFSLLDRYIDSASVIKW